MVGRINCFPLNFIAVWLVGWTLIRCSNDAPSPVVGVTQEANHSNGVFEKTIEFLPGTPSSPHLLSLGELPDDGVLLGVLHCENRSKQVIDLARAITSCGCLVVSGAALLPSESGELTFTLRSHNLSSQQGEAAIFVPLSEGVVRTIQCTWTRASARALLAEQSEDSTSQSVLVDVFGLTARDTASELSAPIPELTMYGADGVWRSIPATWKAATVVSSQPATPIVLWSGQFVVRPSDLADPTALALPFEGAVLTKIQVRVEAQGWSSSQRLELRLPETNLFLKP